RPARDLLAPGTIDDRHFLRIGYIDVDSRAGAVELKALWMTSQLDLANFLERRGIDDRQVAAPCADVEARLVAIDADIVGIVTERELADWLQLRPAECVQIAATAVGHVQRVRSSEIRDALRLIEPF